MHTCRHNMPRKYVAIRWEPESWFVFISVYKDLHLQVSEISSISNSNAGLCRALEWSLVGCRRTLAPTEKTLSFFPRKTYGKIGGFPHPAGGSQVVELNLFDLATLKKTVANFQEWFCNFPENASHVYMSRDEQVTRSPPERFLPESLGSTHIGGWLSIFIKKKNSLSLFSQGFLYLK